MGHLRPSLNYGAILCWFLPREQLPIASDPDPWSHQMWDRPLREQVPHLVPPPVSIPFHGGHMATGEPRQQD